MIVVIIIKGAFVRAEIPQSRVRVAVGKKPGWVDWRGCERRHSGGMSGGRGDR